MESPSLFFLAYILTEQSHISFPPFESMASSPRNYNQPVKPLSNPIAIRPEHIASEETRLHLHPKADIRSATDYIVEDAVTGSKIFSVTGQKYGSGSGREFRDSTGLPLFELHRAGLSRKPWRVRLPGDKNKDLISICMRGASMKIKLNVVQSRATAAGGDRRREEEETVKMKVDQTTALFTFDVLAGNQKVADIRENAEVNDSMGHWIAGPYHYVPPKRVLDIQLAVRLDMSIVSVIILCCIRYFRLIDSRG